MWKKEEAWTGGSLVLKSLLEKVLDRDNLNRAFKRVEEYGYLESRQYWTE
jgi:hypothetical protein